MRDYQPPTPLVRSVTLNASLALSAAAGLDRVREFRYNPSQPRDTRGRWTAADSRRAATEASANHTQHAAATPAEGAAGRGSHLSALKGHLRLIAAHAAHATGNHAAARQHLEKADAHLKAAGDRHGLTPRIQRDMDSLRGELNARTYAAAPDGDLHQYAYDPNQARDHTGRWTNGGAGAEAHGEGAAHHAARREEAKGDKNHQAAARHHATQLAHEAAAHIKGGEMDQAGEKLDALKKGISALHVQTRYAQQNNLGDEEIARRDGATKHYQALQAGLRKAMKSGDLPAVTHYKAGGAATPASSEAPTPTDTASKLQAAPTHKQIWQAHQQRQSASEWMNAHHIAANASITQALDHAGSGNHAAAGEALEQAKGHLQKSTKTSDFDEEQEHSSEARSHDRDARDTIRQLEAHMNAKASVTPSPASVPTPAPQIAPAAKGAAVPDHAKLAKDHDILAASAPKKWERDMHQTLKMTHRKIAEGDHAAAQDYLDEYKTKYEAKVPAYASKIHDSASAARQAISTPTPAKAAPAPQESAASAHKAAAEAIFDQIHVANPALPGTQAMSHLYDAHRAMQEYHNSKGQGSKQLALEDAEVALKKLAKVGGGHLHPGFEASYAAAKRAFKSA